jgi:hypothetical protein
VRFQLEMRPTGGDPPPVTIDYRLRRMARIVAAMSDVGMVIDGGPQPKFPLWAVYGVSDFDSAGRPLGGRATDYEAALAQILSSHGHNHHDGIPVHKLRTNLGWHVTADECAAAVRCFDRWLDSGEEPPSALGTKLIPFLRQAALRDGFEVH